MKQKKGCHGLNLKKICEKLVSFVVFSISTNFVRESEDNGFEACYSPFVTIFMSGPSLNF